MWPLFLQLTLGVPVHRATLPPAVQLHGLPLAFVSVTVVGYTWDKVHTSEAESAMTF